MSAVMLTWDERKHLAELYAPHLVLFPENSKLPRPGMQSQVKDIGDYYPRSVDLLFKRGVLWQNIFQSSPPATLDAIARCGNVHAQLRILQRIKPDPDYAWRAYFALLAERQPNGKTGRDQFPLTVYARVQTRAEAYAASAMPSNIDPKNKPWDDEVGRPFFQPERTSPSDIAIQYWFCYYYDDWANQHEGDWEGICVFLHHDGKTYQPVGASYYAHETGKRRRWAEVEKLANGGTHPLVFAAAGSHASYFQFVGGGYLTTVKNYIVPFLGLKLKVGLASTRVDLVADATKHKPLAPERIELLPDPIAPPRADDPAMEHAKWLAFPGTWGVNVLHGLGFGGPVGPRYKEMKWHNPFVWMERFCTPDFLAY